MSDSAEKIIVLTGAGTGIGRALAVGFCRDGARVIGVGRTEESLAQTAKLCQNERMSIFVGDVSSEQDVDRLVDHAIERHGKVDVLINNAAIYVKRAFLDQSFQEWRQTIEINLLGAALCCRKVLPGMLERRHGRVINIGSFAGVAPLPDCSAYSVSKAALITLTKAIAVEIDRSLYPDVLVNELVPGSVKTRMSEIGSDAESVYHYARALVELPPGGPMGQLFLKDRIVETNHGLRARIKRKVTSIGARVNGLLKPSARKNQ
jgi:NAD(P)-dependent dehydrogenase (short-subunit alcohol dehydrogenase family)